MKLFKITFMSGRVEFVRAMSYSIQKEAYYFWINPIQTDCKMTATQMHVETVERVEEDEPDA